MGFGHDGAGVMGSGRRGRDQGGSAEGRGRREGTGHEGGARVFPRMVRCRGRGRVGFAVSMC